MVSTLRIAAAMAASSKRNSWTCFGGTRHEKDTAQILRELNRIGHYTPQYKRRRSCAGDSQAR
jgi:hypothetical protein